MPLSLLNHSALALFAQRTRIPTSARSIGFCAIWVCISSSSSSLMRHFTTSPVCSRLGLVARRWYCRIAAVVVADVLLLSSPDADSTG